MSRDVPTLRREASIADAVRLPGGAERPMCPRCGRVGHPEGIVTERDLVPLARDDRDGGLARMLARMLEEEHHLFDSMHDLRKAAATRVSDVASAPVHSADPDMALGKVAALMEAFDLGRLPVVEDGRLAGLVRRQDIVRAIAGKT
ncbi:MAG: CBS domain-containing protein [Dehalococcoidia bacterium]|nr:CBS domain-containing protein [Dehalococcoidia bacterium]